MFKHMKRSTVIILTLIILAFTTVVAYAVTTLFFSDTSQTSEYVVDPGESMSINPVITSDATVDMYVFIRVEMASYDYGGLYDIYLNSGWSVEEEQIVGDKYIAVYRYYEALTPGASTTGLADELTMVNMSKVDYAGIDDINVTMTGYACGTDVEEAFAWDSIKANYGM